jgi:hypothetical protein
VSEPFGYAVSDDILTANLGEEIVVLDMERKRYFKLNETAAHIWRALERGLGRHAIEAQVRALYDVDEQTLREALDRLLSDFAQRRLVAVRGAADPREK